jgi:hypothetical protein
LRALFIFPAAIVLGGGGAIRRQKPTAIANAVAVAIGAPIRGTPLDRARIRAAPVL